LGVPIAFRLLEAGEHAVEFALIGARPDTELEAPTAVEIEQRRLAGEPDRVPVGRHDDRRAETDAGRVRGPPRQDLERTGGDGHLERMVLRGPGDGESAVVRHLHHLERMPLHVAHVGVRCNTLHVDGQLELHGYLPRDSVNR
jgi:hypothetical protein